jgi:hypothetical protein
MPNTKTAPVILFAYMRPHHLERSVTSLLRNPEAATTHLTIYCDAARHPSDQMHVDDVRRYVASIDGFASVTCVHRAKNMGLAESIITGVSEALVVHEQVIVLEDDLEVAPHFLRYMNEALVCYADMPTVASIHGYAYPVVDALPETFFLRGADCWGWATWRRAWRHFNRDGRQLLEQLTARGLTRSFDLGGAYPYTRMLQDQIAGRNDSWAVRWHASCFLDDMLTLHPGRSLVSNIGNDDSGTHNGFTKGYDVALSPRPVEVRLIEQVESAAGTRAVAKYFRRSRALPRRLFDRIARYVDRVGLG